MLVVIKKSEASIVKEEKDYETYILGTGKACLDCDIEMILILQEADRNKDALTSWWCCDSCGRTDWIVLLRDLKQDVSKFV